MLLLLNAYMCLLDFNRPLLTGRDYVVGRSDADILLLDRSISRHHAKLHIEYPDKALDGNAPGLPILVITDLSRFGTFLNGTQIVAKTATSVPVDSEITFGAMPGVTVM